MISSILQAGGGGGGLGAGTCTLLFLLSIEVTSSHIQLLGLTAGTEGNFLKALPPLPSYPYCLWGPKPHRAIIPRSMTEQQRSRGEQGAFSVACSHSTWVTAGFSSSFCTNSQS